MYNTTSYSLTDLDIESWLQPAGTQPTALRSLPESDQLNEPDNHRLPSEAATSGSLPRNIETTACLAQNISTEALQIHSEEYLADCEMRLQSPRTIETRRIFIGKLLWFLRHRGYRECGTLALRQFIHYLAHGHEEPGGRFGNKNLTRPVRPVTIRDYYHCLRHLFDWLASQGFIAMTPFQFIPQPRAMEETKLPLTQNQIKLLLQAAGYSTNPARNVAILSFLLDTGCRASELVSIRLENVDMKNRCCTILGKGNKYRTIYFGEKTAEALTTYIRETGRGGADTEEGDGDTPLFLSGLGREPITPSGLLQLTQRLAAASGIKGSCSPHAFRRTFAVQTLKNGANVFSVQAMLGHTNLQMTRRYCALAQADVEAQHRQYSPLDRL